MALWHQHFRVGLDPIIIFLWFKLANDYVRNMKNPSVPVLQSTANISLVHFFLFISFTSELNVDAEVTLI